MELNQDTIKKLRGLILFTVIVVVAGINIATTLSNMFSIVYIAMGSAIGIILGQLL